MLNQQQKSSQSSDADETMDDLLEKYYGDGKKLTTFPKMKKEEDND